MRIAEKQITEEGMQHCFEQWKILRNILTIIILGYVVVSISYKH